MAHSFRRPDLIVTAAALGSAEGGPIEEIRPGDVVCSRPARNMARRHATTAMTHIAISGKEGWEGGRVMEQVTTSNTAS